MSTSFSGPPMVSFLGFKRASLVMAVRTNEVATSLALSSTYRIVDVSAISSSSHRRVISVGFYISNQSAVLISVTSVSTCGLKEPRCPSCFHSKPSRLTVPAYRKGASSSLHERGNPGLGESHSRVHLLHRPQQKIDGEFFFFFRPDGCASFCRERIFQLALRPASAGRGQRSPCPDYRRLTRVGSESATKPLHGRELLETRMI